MGKWQCESDRNLDLSIFDPETLDLRSRSQTPRIEIMSQINCDHCRCESMSPFYACSVGPEPTKEFRSARLRARNKILASTMSVKVLHYDI